MRGNSCSPFPGRSCCVCPRTGGCPRPPPAEPAAARAGTALGSALCADTLGARTQTVSTTAARSSCEHRIASHHIPPLDCAGAGLRCGTPFWTLSAWTQTALATAGLSFWPHSGPLGSGMHWLYSEGMQPACAKDSWLTSCLQLAWPGWYRAATRHSLLMADSKIC